MYNDWQSLSCNPQTRALAPTARYLHWPPRSIWASACFCQSVSVGYGPTLLHPLLTVSEQHSPEVFFRTRQETELKISFASMTEVQQHLACSCCVLWPVSLPYILLLKPNVYTLLTSAFIVISLSSPQNPVISVWLHTLWTRSSELY